MRRTSSNTNIDRTAHRAKYSTRPNPGRVRVLLTRVRHSNAPRSTHARLYVPPAATRAQFGAERAKLVTLAGQLNHCTDSAIGMMVIANEAQPTLDECERLTPMSQKLKGTRLQRARSPRTTRAIKPGTSSAIAPNRTSISRRQQ